MKCSNSLKLDNSRVMFQNEVNCLPPLMCAKTQYIHHNWEFTTLQGGCVNYLNKSN